MRAPDQLPEEPSICIGCGFCCDGTLHDRADVVPDDEAAAKAVGLILALEEGKTVFHQPCPNFSCGQCTVYDRRPSVCRSFRCKLREDLDAGRIPIAEAREKIATVKVLLETIRSVSAESVTPIQRKALWRKLRDEQGSCGKDERQQRAQTMLVIGTLDYLLERHFRRRKNPEDDDSAAQLAPVARRRK